MIQSPCHTAPAVGCVGWAADRRWIRSGHGELQVRVDRRGVGGEDEQLRAGLDAIQRRAVQVVGDRHAGPVRDRHVIAVREPARG